MDFRKGDQVDGRVPGAVNDNGINFLQSNKSINSMCGLLLYKIIERM